MRVETATGYAAAAWCRATNQIFPLRGRPIDPEHSEATINRKVAQYRARSNQPFRCEDCDEWVRLGAKGGKFDLRRRTLHSKFCNREPAPSHKSEMAELGRTEVKKQSPNETCDDCGFIVRGCRC